MVETSTFKASTPYDPKTVEKKWQHLWKKHRLFQANVDPSREKYFVNFPYPYMNGHLHVGHSFSLLRLEFMARYMRMKGRSVLFPFAFHSTGMPIVAAAERVRDREPKQLAILASMGISGKKIPFFEKPENWPGYFIKEALVDLKHLGLAVDWQRSFTTTTLNPYYSRFIEWQFQKLKEGGYLGKGEFPVVWCEHCNSAVGDHARTEGEGVRPQEFTILKFKTHLPKSYDTLTGGKDVYLLAATLRPETVFGQTNLWVDPKGEYLLVDVSSGKKEEVWVMSEAALDKFEFQKQGLSKIGIICGRELVGRSCVAPMIQKEILILPSSFCDPDMGTGIVSSVPSDAPDDWIGLEDLKKDKKMCKRYGLDQEEIRKIEPIPIISSEGWGPLPAEEICRKLGVKDQYDRENLTLAKKEIYKTGFYTGRMKENCGAYAGMPVEFAKKEIMRVMGEMGDADVFYELPDPVVCRCLGQATVKIVNDQWFIRYSDEAWKEKTRKALERLNLFPPLVRKQFEHVIEWLQDWACARMKGLGTPLPWDPDWLIESLSDSTIYMAFYTISNYFNNWQNMDIVAGEKHKAQLKVPAKHLSDAFFDFIFLGKGDAGSVADETGIPGKTLNQMQEEFHYWYPFELRGSGKDLIQNHLGFCLFNHTAIFPEEHWPGGFTLNGWIKVEGEKMSKSHGNFYTLRDMLKKYGADITRVTLTNAGEGINDPNLELSFAETTKKKLMKWFIYSKEHYSIESEKHREAGIEDGKLTTIDRWFLSRLNRTILEVTSQMEQTNFKSALKIGFFDLQNDFRWYQRRAGSPANPYLINTMIETQLRFLSPFIPHYAEELMSQLRSGEPEDEFVSSSPFPEAKEEWMSDEEEKKEEFFKSFIDDIRNILGVTGITPRRIVIYTADDWMYGISDFLQENQITNLSKALGLIMKEEKFRAMGKLVPNFVKRYLPFLNENAKRIPDIDEQAFYLENRRFLGKEFDCVVEVYTMSDKNRFDPEGKSRATIPYRPGVYVK